MSHLGSKFYELIARSKSQKVIQIEKNTRDMVMAVSIATACCIACLVVGWSLVQHVFYNFKVIGELNTTKTTLEDNARAVNELKDKEQAYNDLSDNTDNVSAKRLKPLRLSVDLDNLSVFDNALPGIDDRARLFSSIDNVIMGQVSVSNSALDTYPQEEVANPTPNEVGEANFSLKITGGDDKIREALQSFERSIRPMNIQTLRIVGGSDLSVDLGANTYFIGASNYKLGTKGVY